MPQHDNGDDSNVLRFEKKVPPTCHDTRDAAAILEQAFAQMQDKESHKLYDAAWIVFNYLTKLRASDDADDRSVLEDVAKLVYHLLYLAQRAQSLESNRFLHAVWPLGIFSLEQLAPIAAITAVEAEKARTTAERLRESISALH